jgi:molybdenum cofactor cytidylyltransferase
MNTVGAILLAAGQSRRMGAFKPLLPFGNQTVIDASINYLEQAGIATIVVVLGHRAHDIRQHLKTRNVQFALNPDPSSEMGASIAAGVEALPDGIAAVLIGPVDQPAIPFSVVRTVIKKWSQGMRLVIPTWEGRGGHPVLVDMAFREQLGNLGREGGLRDLFARHRDEVARLPVDSPYIARDMDTWDDYRRLHEEVFGVPPPELPRTSPTKT